MLIPIKYRYLNYPCHIQPEIDEVAGHFDKTNLSTSRAFSLHTEYAYDKRRFDSELMSKFQTISSANKKGIPQLWHSESWAVEFAGFIKSLCGERQPTIIEVHPPFSDYTISIDSFLTIYKVFEELILTEFSQTKILIENRSGSRYRGGTFIITKGEHLRELCELITKKKLNLRIALDPPQLLTSYGGPQNLNPNRLEIVLNRQNPLQSMTESIHLWGKKKSAKGRNNSHQGDLNTYFDDSEKKAVFLKWLHNFLNDGNDRFFVPEVNSSDEDLRSIVDDLESYNIVFK